MADPALIRRGLADALEPLGIQVSPYVLSSPSPPCAYVRSGPIEYDSAFQRGMDQWTFLVYVLVGYVSEIVAQENLDRHLMSHGPKSVKALLEADRKLGGVVFSVAVQSVTGASVYVVENLPPVLGAEWTVIVEADGRE